MKSSAEIIEDACAFLKSQWQIHKCEVVPDASKISLDTDAGEFEGVVLYADMADSSELVKKYAKQFSARIYKAFLHSVCETIRNNGGSITSFDGDRVMAVFIGNRKCSDSAKTALQIKYIVNQLNDAMGKENPNDQFRINYAVGIDVSNLFVIKTGIWGHNYLAWIGNAANTAAKLSEIRGRTAKTFITKRLFERLNDDSKYSISKEGEKKCMWNRSDIQVLGQQVYESNWFWGF